MKEIFASLLIAFVAGLPSPAGAEEASTDMKNILEDKNEALRAEMSAVQAGDLKTFKVITDEDITTLEPGDIYKNNTSFFKVTVVGKKTRAGGSFTVQRTGGSLPPSRSWNRVSGLGPLTIASRETMMDRYLEGGFIMHPITLCLFGVLVISCSNVWLLRRKRQCPPEFVTQAREALARGDLDGFQKLADRSRGILAAICRTMAANIDLSTEEDIKARCESEGRRQINGLRLSLRALNFITAMAPLLGLLGTVQGMVMCFDSVATESASASKAVLMAQGIKIALYTTVYGLGVAMPSLLAYFVSSQALSNVSAECETRVVEFTHRISFIKRAREGGAK
jgi:biopolymer transport protein ExbB